MPSPYDLVSLAAAKSYLGGAAGGNDAKLGQIITSISMAILAATNRGSILPKTFVEIRDGNPNGILLRNWPVQSVQSITVASPGFGGTMSLSPSTFGGQSGYTIDLTDDAPAGSPQWLKFPGGGMCKGDGNVSITYSAGYQINGEVQVVPAGGGQITAIQPYGSWGSDQGVALAGAAMTAVSGAPAQGQYSVSNGVYTFAAADAGKAVSLSYGFVPADLANACLEWIADRLAYQDRVGIASRSLGGQETTSYRISTVPAFVTAMIANYANVVPII